jgi:cation:H+ antiporter
MTLVDGAWIVAFVISLALVLAASDSLVSAIEAAGDRYKWPPGLVGLLAAAGADGPEVSSSVIALAAGAHEISLGVILGSNLFNLAALLGMPILVVGAATIRRYNLLINGLPMLLTTVLALALLLDQQQRFLLEGLTLLVLALQIWLILARPEALIRRLRVPRRFMPIPDRAAEQEERAREREADAELHFPSGRWLLVKALLATGVVIGGCAVLVNGLLYLGSRASVPTTLTGVFGLAALTSLPNVWVALSLARRQRSAVMISAICNSNTINSVFGVCVPALFVTLRVTNSVRTIDVPALFLLTVLSLSLLWTHQGMKRGGALLIVGSYLLFAVVRLTSGH